MSIIDKLFGPKDPIEKRHKAHDKAIKTELKNQKQRENLAARKTECLIMLSDSEAYFKQVIQKEVRNARNAQALGIDPTLNKNHFSDAMRGIECVQRARWYMDTMNSDEGLQGALRLLNRAIRQMDKLDGGVNVVNPATLRKNVATLYEQEGMKQEDPILDSNSDFKYKYENGLFENMVAGMSYEDALKASRQDLNTNGIPTGSASVPGANFSSIFSNATPQVDEEEKRRRAAMLENRKNET